VSKSLSCILMGTVIWLVGCGGGSSSSTTPGNNTVASPANNVATLTAGSGTSNPAGLVNGAFTSVTICAPGTSNCATIGGLLVDTGSTGLRVLSSVLPSGFSLPRQTDGGGNPVVECVEFGDGFTWGPVETADMKIAGEQANSLPLQIIADPNFTAVPAGCTNAALGPNENTVAALGSNGILGVGNFLQDCGPACAASGTPGTYYSCPSTGCVLTTEPLAQQVQHPVALFAGDNNGVILELPAVTGSGAVAENGSLVFGIGTQSNNSLNGATVLTLDAKGNFTTSFNNASFPGSFVDSGSNGIFFLDSASAGMPMCPVNTDFYCPATTKAFSVSNIGANGQSTPVTFSVGNGDVLLANSNPNFLLPNLAAPNPGIFDFGLPFFLGRNVYAAIEGKSTPGGLGPYVAY
jgi:hypothetical protein